MMSPGGRIVWPMCKLLARWTAARRCALKWFDEMLLKSDRIASAVHRSSDLLL
jgi:hypothetical protein